MSQDTQDRAANFSSSSIYKLMTNGRQEHGFGAPAIDYIKEKRMESRLGRSLSYDINAKPINWGNLCEMIVFDLLGTEYEYLDNKGRLMHPDVPHWSGIPDAVAHRDPKTVGDIKCPFTMKSFCQIVDTFNTKGDHEPLKAERPEYYWQLVSNAILTGCTHAELIVYVPYLEELPLIRELADQYTGDQNKVAFVNWATDRELPYLIKGKHYKNLNRFVFEVPHDDIEALTERVRLAGTMLSES